MAVDSSKLVGLEFDEVEHAYSQRDTMLYALGVGFGADPLDQRQLRFVFEKALQAVPSMAITLAYPRERARTLAAAGLHFDKFLHGEQGFELYRPLPAAATLAGKTRIAHVVDKGAAKGLLLVYETPLVERASGALIGRLTSTTVCRADGGGAGYAATPAAAAALPVLAQVPSRAADGRCDLATLRQAALLYRLSGDYNPLHADPATAAKAGFAQPILHGRCTFGVACHALLRACLDYDAARLSGMSARFSAPVYPGETLSTEYWYEGDEIAFRVRVLERDVVVLDRGRARLHAAGHAAS
ncbi:MAG: MaoC/PaaZ C-terminal domain-containing protein [Janthinobacterium lividum]